MKHKEIIHKNKNAKSVSLQKHTCFGSVQEKNTNNFCIVQSLEYTVITKYENIVQIPTISDKIFCKK